jgi:hypothetical protein
VRKCAGLRRTGARSCRCPANRSTTCATAAALLTSEGAGISRAILWTVSSQDRKAVSVGEANWPIGDASPISMGFIRTPSNVRLRRSTRQYLIAARFLIVSSLPSNFGQAKQQTRTRGEKPPFRPFLTPKPFSPVFTRPGFFFGEFYNDASFRSLPRRARALNACR